MARSRSSIRDMRSLRTKIMFRIAGGIAALAAATLGAIAATPSANAATLCRSYTYSVGGSGSCVQDIQKITSLQIAAFAYFQYGVGRPAVTWDGVYGPQTKAAVQELQGLYGLTRDGIVGPRTWASICGSEWDGVGNVTQAEVNAYNAAIVAACGSSAHRMTR